MNPSEFPESFTWRGLEFHKQVIGTATTYRNGHWGLNHVRGLSGWEATWVRDGLIRVRRSTSINLPDSHIAALERGLEGVAVSFLQQTEDFKMHRGHWVAAHAERDCILNDLFLIDALPSVAAALGEIEVPLKDRVTAAHDEIKLFLGARADGKEDEQLETLRERDEFARHIVDGASDLLLRLYPSLYCGVSSDEMKRRYIDRVVLAVSEALVAEENSRRL